MSLKVSIITPSFNQGNFIKQTIESVLTQDYHNFEYIIIDGGSTDNTIDIIKQYEGQLKYISEKDGGQSNAINKGFLLASGDIVAWLNSDDTYEPGTISSIVKLFEDSPQTSLVYGEGYIIDEKGNRVKKFENTMGFNLWVLIYVWDYIMQPTTFFRVSALKTVGYLDETLNWTMDWDLWLKLSLKYNVLYTNQFLANSREYTKTKTSTGGLRRIKEIRKLTSKYSGKTFTKGFWLFFYDWLSKKFKNKYIKQKFISYAVNILKKLPIPDADNNCGEKTCFCVRTDIVWQKFKITITEDYVVKIVVFVNKKKTHTFIYNKSGEYEIEVDVSNCRNYTTNLIEFILCNKNAVIKITLK